MTDEPSTLIPPFATKVAIVVRDDLLRWQRLNVTAFLAAGIAATYPQLIGEPYRDGDGGDYLALLGMPVVVLEGSAHTMATARQRAQQREIPTAIYTADMFVTGHDAANRAVVAAVAADDLDLVGLALHAPKNVVDKIVKGAHLHPA